MRSTEAIQKDIECLSLEAKALDKLFYNLHYCLRSMVQYIQRAPDAPLMWVGKLGARQPVIETHDFKLAMKTLEEATQVLADIKAMNGPELVNTGGYKDPVLGVIV